MFQKLKTSYLIYIKLLPTLFIKRLLHLLFLGPIRPSWSLEFTFAITGLSYLMNIFPAIGLTLSRFAQDNFSGYKFWECITVGVKVPKLRDNTEIKGFLKDFYNGTSDQFLDSDINCEFLVYKDEAKWSPIRDFFQLLIDILFPPKLTTSDFKQAVISLKSQTQLSRDSIILYIHGGGFMAGSLGTHRMLVTDISKITQLPVFHLDYGLSPDNQYPSALFEIFSVYKFLLDPHQGLGYSPEQILIGGDSAGGNLALSFSYYLRDFGFKLPKGQLLLSPWLDLTQSHASWKGPDHDYLSLEFMGGEKIGNYYAPNQLENPYASPYYGRVNDLGKILIQYGEVEKLSGEINDFSNKFNTTKNSKLRLECYTDMPHVFQIFSFDSQSALALKNIKRFVDDCYDTENEQLQSVSRVTYPKVL
ncbi:alpha/beta-hydrolase [Conidiobolus coronatus NRRL 28638]|uniref:Alpha/beta-hydrolase n=1 Tax=Conidiobolus coronatus (strain ATCC 28846 / CBS 209.66 / NRRL 28638) TaxID=796925 RepID=A0A137P711_CONC2|nr:alpha/beta-hydrolase [Conidiobolus coronatus NRRL 28638]|eukprot:KXN70788.1 alpha/beta-hydrolase [Conidiobolus coronatus NRRL 28638]